MDYETARAAEEAALAKWQASRDQRDFYAFTEAVTRRERAMYERHHCYGVPYKCISCGCSAGAPCVSHKGSAVYRNELLERIGGVQHG